MCNFSQGVLEKSIAEGRAEGIAKGRTEGLTEGQTSMLAALSQLLLHLQNAGREQEFTAAATNMTVAQKLFKEFGISI